VRRTALKSRAAALSIVAHYPKTAKIDKKYREENVEMRLFILMLSIGCVVSYGYALAGYVGGVFGRGRPDYIAWGLGVGTLCGAAAIFLWKDWFAKAVKEAEEADGSSADGSDSKKPESED
jgi:hypothetical protein